MAVVHKIAPETSEAHPQRGKKTIRRYLGINGFHVCEGMQAELMFCVMEILDISVYWIQVWPAFSQFCPCKTHIFFGTRQQPQHGSRWQHGLHSAMNAGHYQMQTRKCVAKTFKIHCPSYVEKSWETCPQSTCCFRRQFRMLKRQRHCQWGRGKKDLHQHCRPYPLKRLQSALNLVHGKAESLQYEGAPPTVMT